jgi:hypothetical protein
MNKVLVTALVAAVIAFFYYDGDKKFGALVSGSDGYDDGYETTIVDDDTQTTTPKKSSSRKKKVVLPIDKDAPRRMIIGLDLSASNPLVLDAAYAQKVGRRVGKEIESLEFRSEMRLRTFGAYGASNNPIAFDAIVSTKARPEVLARDVNTFISNIPNLVKRGELKTQNYTNILAFLEELAIELDCKELPTQIILVTDGIEDSEYVRLIHRDAKLPRTKKIFKGCYELQILGANGWFREELEELVAMIEREELTPVIDKVLPLEEVNEAFRLLEEREVFGKVVLIP